MSQAVATCYGPTSPRSSISPSENSVPEKLGINTNVYR